MGHVGRQQLLNPVRGGIGGKSVRLTIFGGWISPLTGLRNSLGHAFSHGWRHGLNDSARCAGLQATRRLFLSLWGTGVRVSLETHGLEAVKKSPAESSGGFTPPYLQRFRNRDGGINPPLRFFHSFLRHGLQAAAPDGADRNAKPVQPHTLTVRPYLFENHKGR